MGNGKKQMDEVFEIGGKAELGRKSRSLGCRRRSSFKILGICGLRNCAGLLQQRIDNCVRIVQ